MRFEGFVAHGKSAKGHNHYKNDDRFVLTTLGKKYLLMGVSDGLGGHPGGDIAAELVMSCLKSVKTNGSLTSSNLKNAISEADIMIVDKISKSPEFTGMGATATALIISDGWGYWAHIGDTRLYLLRDNVIQIITEDHSYLSEFIDAGTISLEEAEKHPLRHVLDQCVGCIVSGIDTGRFQVQPGDTLLVCSDGLYRAVEETRITDFLTTAESVSQCVDYLIDAALQVENCDDVTVSIAKNLA